MGSQLPYSVINTSAVTNMYVWHNFITRYSIKASGNFIGREHDTITIWHPNSQADVSEWCPSTEIISFLIKMIRSVLISFNSQNGGHGRYKFHNLWLLYHVYPNACFFNAYIFHTPHYLQWACLPHFFVKVFFVKISWRWLFLVARYYCNFEILCDNKNLCVLVDCLTQKIYYHPTQSYIKRHNLYRPSPFITVCYFGLMSMTSKIWFRPVLYIFIILYRKNSTFDCSDYS